MTKYEFLERKFEKFTNWYNKMNCLYCNSECFLTAGSDFRCLKCPYRVVIINGVGGYYSCFSYELKEYVYQIHYYINNNEISIIKRNSLDNKCVGRWVFENCNGNNITPYNISEKIKTILTFH